MPGASMRAETRSTENRRVVTVGGGSKPPYTNAVSFPVGPGQKPAAQGFE